MEAQPVQSLLRSLRWLQTSREYSDLRIICGRKTSQVHKAIICPRSKYFATSCKWNQDGKVKDEIRLNDDDPIIIGLMIDYLYQMDYDDLLPSKSVTSPVEESLTEEILTEQVSPVEIPTGEPDLLVAESVSYHGNFSFNERVMGDEYISDPEPAPEHETFEASSPVSLEWSDDDNRKSKKDRKKKSKRARVNNSGSEIPCLEPDGKDLRTARLTINALVYAMADKYEIDNLKDIARSKFEKAVLHDWKSPAFAYAADLVSSTTPSSDQGLRSIVINTINEHRELVSYGEIQSLLDSGNGMAWGLVQVLLSSSAHQRHVDNYFPRYRNHH